MSAHIHCLDLRHSALKGEQNQVSAATHAELVQQVGNMELDGALGNIELAGDFLVGEILEQRTENRVSRAAEMGDSVSFKAPSWAVQNEINEARQQETRHQNPAVRD